MSRFLMVRSRVSGIFEVVDCRTVCWYCLAAGTWLCLFELLHLTASSKTRIEIYTYEEVCAYKKGALKVAGE